MTNNYSSSGFSLKTLLPFLSLAFGFNSSKTTTSYSTGGFSSNMNRGIGTAAATVGFLSLAILKFVADSNRLADENGSSNNDNDEAIHQLLNRSEVLFHVVKTFLRNMILRQRCKGKLEQDSSEEEDDNEEYNEPMIHKGSCHCRSVRFELVAPQKIMYKNATSGKIQFRHARIRARSFRFVKGEHYVRMYYVSKPSRNQALKKKSPKSNNEEVGAHSFCSRCGVNILYAPNSHSTALEINLDCLDQDDLKLRPAVGKDGNLSRGFAVVQQWDEDQENGRYPSTIVEENPMAIFPPLDQQQSPFSGLQPNVLKQQDSMTEPDSLYDGDDDTINSDAYCVRTNGSKLDPGTPSTVCTSQTAERIVSFSSNHNLHGVLPSLSLDTPRASSNDTESVASITSSRSAFPSSSSDTLFTRQHSSSSRSLSISTAGPMMRHQMKYYMQKHMSSSPTASSMTSPTSGSEPKKNTLEVPTRIIKKW